MNLCRYRPALVLLLLGLAAVGGCGQKGPLQLPPAQENEAIAYIPSGQLTTNAP